ncbi:MAG: hypothetical protein NTY38_19045 [Acidobacteria bacterium]|nr:hypothetical protein [Acidobacteriota bacterium]
MTRVQSAFTRRRFLMSAAGAGLAGYASAQNTTGSVPFSYINGQPLRIGNQFQFLLDEYVVEDRWKLTRKLGRVIKHMRNPVVVQDRPWEEAVGAYPSVLFDDKTGKFRMWYQVASITNYFSRHLGPAYYVGYAESDDAYNWTKPALEGFPFGAYKRTNIVTTGRGGRRASAPHVQLNPDQSDPQRRYMMLNMGWGTVDLAYSGDGLHWDILEKPLFNFHTDFANHLVWCPEQKLWHLYLRPAIRPQGGTGPLPEGLRHTGRRLAVALSPDLQTWSMPRTILYPDERDEPDYDMVHVFRRHGLFIALHSQMQQEKGNSENQVYLATSRDGIHWERTWDRKPFIPLGAPGSFDGGQVEPATSPPLELGNDLLMYYYAAPSGQKEWFDETGIGLCRMRRERFIGQWASAEDTGYLVTREFLLEGTRLELNCSAVPAPYWKATDGIRVASFERPDFATRTTMYEKAIPGFTMDDCDRMTTDGLAIAVKWKGNADLSSLKGKAVYLRFELKRSGIYGFRIAA